MMHRARGLLLRFFDAVAGVRTRAPLMQWSLFLLSALVPLAAWPVGATQTAQPLKIALLVIAAFVALFGWSAHVYKARTLRLRRAPWVWLPVTVLVGIVLSALMQGAGYRSWMGASSMAFTAAVPMIALIVVYLLCAHEGGHRMTLRAVTFGWLVGGCAAGVTATLSLFGAMGGALWNPTGTTESLTLLLSMLGVWVAGIWVSDDHTRDDSWLPTRRVRLVFYTLATILLALMLLWLSVTDTQPTQIVLLVGAGVLVALGLFQPQRFAWPKRMAVPLLMLAFALFLLLAPSPFAGRVPVQVGPSIKAAAQIARDTWKTDGALFGSGPDTYLYDYTRFKPVEINQTPLWSVRFDESLSHVLNVAATWGVLASALYVAWMIWTLWAVFHALVVKRVREEWQTMAVFVSVWTMGATAQIVYAFDVTHATLFMSVSGLLVAAMARKTWRVRLGGDPRAALLASFGFVKTGVFMVLALVVASQLVAGEVLAAQSRVAVDAGRRMEILARAVAVNPWRADYQRQLARALVARGEQQAANGLAPDVIRETLFQAMASADRAVALEPRHVESRRVRREAYEAVAPFAFGADREALDSALAAMRLEPSHAARHNEVARAFVVAADTARTTVEKSARASTVGALLQEAERHAQHAIELRPSYASSYYTRGLVYQRQGRLDEAIAQMMRLVTASPKDAVLRFELGVLQLHKGDRARAQKDFEAALALQPTFANAKWYLASIFEAENRTQDAIVQLEDIAVLDPSNTRVRERLELMRAGLEAPTPEETEPLE